MPEMVQQSSYPKNGLPSTLQFAARSSSILFHGCGLFRPYLIKIGQRTHKKWGIVFKCLTTHAVHLDLLASMDTDSFLMALHCFITRRGKHIKLLSDHDMHSKGGSSELKNAFKSLITTLQTQLASQQIIFQFNPPYAPHLGGSWEG